jgi:hypothetical protein
VDKLIPMKLSNQIANAIDVWITTVMHDEAVEFPRAAEIVLAKIKARAATTKRQELKYEGGKFIVCTTHRTEDGIVSHTICDQPHVEVTKDGIKTGCITFPNAVILEMVKLMFEQLSKNEPTVAQKGYMPR